MTAPPAQSHQQARAAGRPVNLDAFSGLLIECLAAGALLLAVAHFINVIVASDHMRQMFDLGAEANPGAWFSSSVHLINAILLAVIASTADRGRTRWTLLAVVVLAASMDETVSLHERLSQTLEHAFHTSGLFAAAWVIPGMALVGILAAMSFALLYRVAGGRIVLAGAAVFVVGAIGVESIENARLRSVGWADPGVLAIIGVEETLEMAGSIVVTTGLLRILGILQTRQR